MQEHAHLAVLPNQLLRARLGHLVGIGDLMECDGEREGENHGWDNCYSSLTSITVLGTGPSRILFFRLTQSRTFPDIFNPVSPRSMFSALRCFVRM